MSTEFPFVHVPTELYAVFGEPVPGTRIFRRAGPQEEIAYWQDAVFDTFGSAVSPGGAAGYAQVSRAAIHKRMKDGKLTCFLFDTTHRKRNIFGSTKEVRELAVSLIPVSECKAWAEELKLRALENGLLTKKDIEGDKPDWHGAFIEWNSKWQREQARKQGGKRK